MENVIAPPAGNVSRRRAPDGRKLLLIFGNRINSTLAKYFKKDVGFVYINWRWEWHQIYVLWNDSLNPRGNAYKSHQCFDLKCENVLSFNARNVVSPHSY